MRKIVNRIMNELKSLRPHKENNELDLKSITVQELYEQGCQSAVYWDLVRHAHLSKK